MRELIVIFVTMALVNNLVLVQGLGICPTIKLTATAGRSAFLGSLVALAMVMAVALTWPLEHYLLTPYHLEYFRILVYVPLICAAGFLLLQGISRIYPAFCAGGLCLNSLLVTNCAVVGLPLLLASKGYSFGESMVAALGSGIGFILVLVLFSGMRHQIDRTKGIPEAFRGIPLYLAAAAVLSVVLTAFSGVAVGIFT